MTENKEFLGTEPIPKLLLRLAVPAITAQLINMLYNIVDRIYCAAMFLFGIQMACQFTFTAIGNAVCSIIVAVVRKFVLLIPLIYIVPLFVSDKARGVYMAEPIADVIAVTFTSILFYIQFKKAMKQLEG